MTTGYFIEDQDSAAETARLVQLHTCLSRHLGNVVTDVLAPGKALQMLDIGCGSGDWALDLAQRAPTCQIIGIDISEARIDLARKQALMRDLFNIRFLLMDATAPLGFPDATFDVIHVRFGQSYLSAAAWPPFLAECRRVLRPGGHLVLIECENPISTARAFERLCAAYAEASRRTGFGYTPCGSQLGITAMLAAWLRQGGYEDIEDVVQALDFSFGAPAHEELRRYFQMLLPLAQPFLIQSGAVSQTEVAALSRLALSQMQEPGFCAIWYFRSVWGSRPA
ncbi:MAG TPA: class I SAM-dependent methyltransferase [Ktedonobacteraceae bacterium]|jgi:ubiquinone/menaquinone biosynthesis C-methylase UbiE|nr:class I SAM-dependent methyltransferase [Ktedonobacteraceae bacterium]